MRIPLLVSTFGAAGYGTFATFVSLWPIGGVLLEGFVGAARVLPLQRGARAILPYSLRRAASVEMVVLGSAASATGAAAFFVSQATSRSLSLMAIMLVTICGTVPFAWARGALDHGGRSALSNLALAAPTVIGLPLLWATLPLGSLTATISAGFVGLALPYLVSWLVTVRSGRHSLRRQQLNEGSSYSSHRLVAAMTTYSCAGVLAYGFDTVIIATALGPVAAGQYSLAARIMTVAIFVPIGLTGILTAELAKKRRLRDAAGMQRWLRRATLLFCILGIALGIVGCTVGPLFAGVLGAHQVSPPFVLFGAQALYAALTTASAPIMASFTTRHGAAVRGRVTLGAGVANLVMSFFSVRLVGIAGPVLVSVAVNLIVLLILVSLARTSPSMQWDD